MGNTNLSSSVPTITPILKKQWTTGGNNANNGNNNNARYNDKELTLLDRMFQDLARRSPAKTMSKATFLEYFSLPGILGERLFEVFDTAGDGVIHFEEFVNGLARYNHGTIEDKIGMLFEMFDMDGQQQVNREELTIILYSVITPTTALFFNNHDDDDEAIVAAEQKEQPSPAKPVNLGAMLNASDAVSAQNDNNPHNTHSNANGNASINTAEMTEDQIIGIIDRGLDSATATKTNNNNNANANAIPNININATVTVTDNHGNTSNNTTNTKSPLRSRNQSGLYEDQGTKKITHVSEFTRNTVSKLVDDAFEVCDTNKDGLLSRDQFAHWVRQNPSALQLLETAFAKHLWSGFGSPGPNGHGGAGGHATMQSQSQLHPYPNHFDENNNYDAMSDEEGFVFEPGFASHANGGGGGGIHIGAQSVGGGGSEFKNGSNSYASLQNLHKTQSLHRSSSYKRTSRMALTPNLGSNHRMKSPRFSALQGGLDRPLMSMPDHFQPLYDALAEQYYEDSLFDEHTVYVCTPCKLVFCTSLYIDEKSMISKELKNFTTFVVFKKAGAQEITLQFCPECGASFHRTNVQAQSYLDLQSAIELMPAASGTANINVISKEGILYKIGKQTKTWVERYYAIKEKFLYTFKKQSDAHPASVLFISGWFIARLEQQQGSNKHYFGLVLTPPHVSSADASFQSKRLYAKSKEERDAWIRCLQEAASTVSIEAHYKIGKTLGKGHFSVVHLGTHLLTAKTYAIKVVEKKRIDAREKMSLRNEIAIMKLVNHPCIIRMEDIFEDKKCIYMVMTLVPHGDFFARWQKKKRFDEDTTRVIIWKLLDAIQYLHSLGIVHRDLKPENILCLSETDDTKIVISDFGLSKFAAPHTEMTMPCGTLAYVAPEVLSMKGYGRKVDLWSLGCIMHLLLRSVLPFDGHAKEDIIERTLNKQLRLTGPKWEHVTDIAKDLIFQLLIKDPSKRITLKAAMEHEFFAPLKMKKEMNMHLTISPTVVAVLNSGLDTPVTHRSIGASPSMGRNMFDFGSTTKTRNSEKYDVHDEDNNNNSMDANDSHASNNTNNNTDTILNGDTINAN